MMATRRTHVTRSPLPCAPEVHVLRLGRTAAASNVYLVTAGGTWVLVDTGWAGSAQPIVTAAEAVHGPDAVPAAVVLTHIHPDHAGAVGQLARSWGVPVYVHPDELVMAHGRYVPEYGMPLDRRVIVPMMRRLPRRTRERMERAGDITDVVRALDEDAAVPALPGWRWIHTPGHTPGHTAYLRPADGVLISGDAVLTVDLNSVSEAVRGRPHVAPPPWYTTWDWTAARDSVRMLAALTPGTLLPGHGHPIGTGVTPALRELAERWPPRPGAARRPVT